MDDTTNTVPTQAPSTTGTEVDPTVAVPAEGTPMMPGTADEPAA
jgi:hypothetical protein